jgi:membrane protease YdiL (CAAX protease family)
LGALPAASLRNLLPFNLPISALVAFCPIIAASILAYRRSGLAGMRQLLGRTFDYHSAHRVWYLVSLVTMPAILVLAYVIMKVTGRPLPSEPHVALAFLPVTAALFLVPAIGEEVGWQGYAFDPMEDRFGALRAGLLLGVVWAAWHSVSFFQTGEPLRWILWQSMTTVALRVLISWVYLNAGRSVLAAIVFHAATNVAEFSFPNAGSHYDPFVTSVLMWALVGVIVVSMRGWHSPF